MRPTLVALLLVSRASAHMNDLDCVLAAWPASLSSLYQFSGGEKGLTIGDGGDDMFDNGNELRVRVNGQWSAPLEYTQQCDEEDTPVGKGDAEYATCKLSGTAPVFAAVFSSETGTIDGVRIAGNLGADGQGHQSTNAVPLTTTAPPPAPPPREEDSAPPLPAGTHISPPPPLPPPTPFWGPAYGYYKQVFGAGYSSSDADPSVNHLVIARTKDGRAVVGTTTDSDLHEVTFGEGVYYVYYLMWAGDSGYQYDEADFQGVLDAVATSCYESAAPPRSPPPPSPSPSGSACRRPCAGGTCEDFRFASCDWIKSVEHIMCDCSGCCGQASLPPPPPSPPPVPLPPSPSPRACLNKCHGATCGSFGKYSCSAFAGLGCDCSGCCVADTDLTCATDAWAGIEPALPNLYAFTEGYAGRGIRDGGSDMYDGGNYLAVKGKDAETGKSTWEFGLPYTQDCAGLFPTPAGVGDIQYGTCKLMDGRPHTLDSAGDVTAGTLFAAVFYSPSASIDGMMVYGNLGADDNGHSWAHNATGPKGVRAYYKEVFGAGSDPSISHLILARGGLKYARNPVTTNSDFQYVLFSEGQQLLVYLLWAGKKPSLIPGLDYAASFKFEATHVQQVVDAVAPACFAKLPPAAIPPSPPPPPPSPPVSDDCGRECRGQTCLAFRDVACSTLEQAPWGCKCHSCCAPEAVSPPPPSPPAPPSLPPPGPPTACSSPCAGATCGDFMPYTCDGFSEVLGCDCGGCCETPLDLRCADDVWPANLPALYEFSGGTLGYNIGDGGNDMFDNGNELRLRVNGEWSSPLFYTQVCDGSQAADAFWEDRWSPREREGVFDAQYLTCKLDKYEAGYGAAFVFVARSKAGTIDGFQVVGNVGADAGGTQEKGELKGPKGTVGHYKLIHGTADPSVNHLIFSPGAGGAKTTIGTTTDSDLHEVTFPHGVKLLYYVLWAGKEGYRYQKDAVQTVLDKMAESCVANDYSVADWGGGGGGGGDGGTIALVVIVLLLLVALLGLSWYKGWFAGVADKLGDLTSSRARTGMGSGTMAPTAPLGSLAASDAQLTTSYQAPTTPA